MKHIAALVRKLLYQALPRMELPDKAARPTHVGWLHVTIVDYIRVNHLPTLENGRDDVGINMFVRVSRCKHQARAGVGYSLVKSKPHA